MNRGPDALHHSDGDARWVLDERWASVTRATTPGALAAYDHLLVVAAHPDDECLGAGAFVADAASLGVDVTILVLTDGEGSHPHSPTVDRTRMASLRSAEADRAAATLAPSARIVHAGLPDGGLGLNHEHAVSEIKSLTRDGTLVIAPWTADGHPDHDAAGRAAAEVAGAARNPGEERVGLAHYVVWLWHWGQLDDLPWAEVVVVDATLDGISVRERALAEHRTQRLPLSSAAGDELLLTTGVLAPSRRGFTTLVWVAQEGSAHPDQHRGPEPVGPTFDEMFDHGDDPWLSQSWFERRKRALTLATLCRERYERVLDLGCSTGSLTTALAARADSVVAVDASARALDVARRGSGDGTTWVHGQAPAVMHELDAAFDLVVLSEIGYFLTPFDLWLTLAAVLRRLVSGGELVLVHWRHSTQHIPLDGPEAHAQVHAVCEQWVTVSYEDDDVLIVSYTVTR